MVDELTISVKKSERETMHNEPFEHIPLLYKWFFLGSGSGHQSGVGSGKDGDGLDVMSTIKDPNIKEIVAKESLQVWTNE